MDKIPKNQTSAYTNHLKSWKFDKDISPIFYSKQRLAFIDKTRKELAQSKAVSGLSPELENLLEIVQTLSDITAENRKEADAFLQKTQMIRFPQAADLVLDSRMVSEFESASHQMSFFYHALNWLKRWVVPVAPAHSIDTSQQSHTEDEQTQSEE